MNLYLAPMEGITGYTYRQVFLRHFGFADKCFTPFISPHEKLGQKVINEISKDNNDNCQLIPQIMVADSKEAKNLEKLILPYGYDELNINAGCPSGTVVTKARGAGLLKDPNNLERLLDGIFTKDNTCKYSIKTRLGWEDLSEWENIIKIISWYPFSEVIIHARLREEFYTGKPHIEAMQIAREYIEAPLCYNGDIYSVSDVKNIKTLIPELDSIMIGRGVLRNPLLFEEIKEFLNDDSLELKNEHEQSKEANKRIYDFMQDICETYLALFKSEKNTLFHMKELWGYLGYNYSDKNKELKILRKTNKLSEYNLAVKHILL